MSISCDTLIAGINNTFKYTGDLSKTRNVFMRYSTNNWETVNEVKLVETPKGFQTTLSLPDEAQNIEFAFRDGLGNWDNNFEQNYSYTIYPQNIIIPKEELEPSFFSTDFLLESNINKEIKKEQEILADFFDEFSISENGEIFVTAGFKEEHTKNTENSTSNALNIEIQNFESELAYLIEEKHADLFQIETAAEKPVAVASAFNGIEIAESDKIEYAELPSSVLYFKSNTPLVKMYQERRFEQIFNMIKVENSIADASLEKSLYKSSVPELSRLKKIAAQMLLEQNVETTNKEISNFLVVSPSSNLDPFDNSLLASLFRYQKAISNAFKKLKELIKESFSKETN